MVITSSGNVGIGTTTPYSRLSVWGPDTLGTTGAFLVANSASTTEFVVNDDGSATLAGTLTQNSDQRLKTNVQSLDASSSLAAIESLNPVSFDWVNGMFGSTTQLGFIAQQVQPIFPDLVSTTSPTALTFGGTLGLNYTGLIAPIVKAIQAIVSISGEFRDNLIAWLGDAGNGIKDLYASVLHANELCLSDAGGTSCYTRSQLDAALAAAASVSAGGDSSGASVTTSSAPVIEINGANPAMITVGAAYNDLGATITGPTADLNLGIRASVDGATSTAMSAVTIDTSVAGTHTIEYSATDQNGLTGTASRTVIVSSGGDSSNIATSTATSTSSSSTAATTTAATTPTSILSTSSVQAATTTDATSAGSDSSGTSTATSTASTSTTSAVL